MLLVDPLLLTAVRTHSSRKNKWLETCLYHLHQNEMMPGVAANPTKQHTFLLCLQGQLFRASHSVSQQLWPNEINISIILYKHICPCTLDFHCHSSWSSRKRGWKMVISLPGGNFLFVDLLVWIRQSIIRTPTFTQKVVARKSELEIFALVWNYPQNFMLYEAASVSKLTEGKGRGEREWTLTFGNYNRHLCVHPFPTLKKIFWGK